MNDSTITPASAHRAIIRSYITNDLLLGQDLALDDRASLYDGGILDSVGVMELVAFLENQFTIAINDRDLTEENFGSIESIARFIGERLRNGIPAAAVDGSGNATRT